MNLLPMLPSIVFTKVAFEEQTRPYQIAGRLCDLLTVIAVVKNRNTREDVEIRQSSIVPTSFTPEKFDPQWLRSKLLELCAHEIDEMLFVAGLGKDPHAPIQYEAIEIPLKVMRLKMEEP
jgi:hypothetical protein